MMRQRPSPLGCALLLAGTAAATLAGCSSGPSRSVASSSNGPGSSSVSGSTAGTVAPGLSVDLQITGPKTLTARGSNGKCVIQPDGVYAFEIAEKDYPGIGQAFEIDKDSGPVGLAGNVKWAIDDTTGYLSDNATTTLTFSADLKTLRVDARLMGGPAGAEHVTGTVICP